MGYYRHHSHHHSSSHRSHSGHRRYRRSSAFGYGSSRRRIKDEKYLSFVVKNGLWGLFLGAMIFILGYSSIYVHRAYDAGSYIAQRYNQLEIGIMVFGCLLMLTALIYTPVTYRRWYKYIHEDD